VSQTWGRPANDTGAGWAVVDVETSGFRPGQARIVSVAALALGDDGNVEQSLYTLLNPGVDPGPTHVHGLTTEMLQGQPCFGDVVGNLIDLLKDRTLVAHNVGFDYSFLAAEAELVGAELPIDTVMCTVELTRRLELGTENLRLETLAAHWGITQMKPHDALDDAMVLAQILKPVLVRARERKAWLPVRSVTTVLAQRSGHARGAAAAEDARCAAAVPVSEPWTVCRGPAVGAGHAGGVVGRGAPHPRGAHRADRARRAGLHRRRRPRDLPGDLQRARTRARQGLSGQ
jgi:DNA polymerase III epsilon subunit family exonuclease